MPGTLPAELKTAARRVEAELARLLPPGAAPLARAMRHAALSGGKRLRPFLLAASARLCGAQLRNWRAPAALECVHAYSLIHDDLPCMDDAQTRRGQPALHRIFGEAPAILAGDGLLTLAFAILSDPATDPSARIRARLCAILAGGGGDMVHGQARDVAGEQGDDIRRLKTGALMAAACEMGAVIARAPPPAARRLRQFGAALGLAFQLRDDALDAGPDPALAPAARKAAEEAVSHLALFGKKADLLSQAARFAAERQEPKT